MNRLKSYLRELTALCGPSSHEDDIIRYMVSHLIQFDPDLTIDTLGNITCRFSSGCEDAKKVMIFSHMDEVGFVVRKVEANGFLRVERVGGTNMNVIPGSVVNVLAECITPGIIGTKSYHFLKPHERGVIPTIDEVYVDIGVKSRGEAEQLGVQVGTFATFQSNFMELQGSLVANKSIDNRVGCAVLLELAERLSHERLVGWDVYLVACVQEEFNIRGLMPAVRQISPDVSIGIDVTPSCDTPDLEGYSDVVIEQGPALACLNYHGRGTLAGVLPDKRLMDFLIDTARDGGIPFQREVSVGVITENAFALFENFGIAVASVSIPTRYTHSPVEVVSLTDVNNTIELLMRYLLNLRADTTFGKTHLRNR